MVLMELMEQYQVDNIEEHFQGNQHLPRLRPLQIHNFMDLSHYQLFFLPLKYHADDLFIYSFTNVQIQPFPH